MMYWGKGDEGKAPNILNLSNGWMRTMNFIPQSPMDIKLGDSQNQPEHCSENFLLMLGIKI
jgi:hypothetical protein